MRNFIFFLSSLFLNVSFLPYSALNRKGKAMSTRRFAEPVTKEIALALSREKEGFFVHVECKDGKSSKFWKARCDAGCSEVVISWGRIGTEGQSISKDMGYFLQKIDEKLNKGYAYVEKTMTVIPRSARASRQVTATALHFEKTMGREYMASIEKKATKPSTEDKPLSMREKLRQLENSSEW